jgi:hypothetical protein
MSAIGGRAENIWLVPIISLFDPKRALAAPPTTLSAKEQQEGVRQSENEDYVEQVEKKHVFSAKRCTSCGKSKLSRGGEQHRQVKY